MTAVSRCRSNFLARTWRASTSPTTTMAARSSPVSTRSREWAITCAVSVVERRATLPLYWRMATWKALTAKNRRPAAADDHVEPPSCCSARSNPAAESSGSARSFPMAQRHRLGVELVDDGVGQFGPAGVVHDGLAGSRPRCSWSSTASTPPALQRRRPTILDLMSVAAGQLPVGKIEEGPRRVVG